MHGRGLHRRGLHGLVLAGGRSRRMGEDKGALRYGALPQAQAAAKLLAAVVDEVFVSLRFEQLGQTHLKGLIPIIDHYDCDSPANGIASAIRAHGGAWLVLAVDMPQVDEAALRILIRHRDKSALATCFESPVKGGPDPLLAIWEEHAFGVLDSELQVSSHLCPYKLLWKHGAHVVRGAVSEDVLRNVNTPDELAALRESA